MTRQARVSIVTQAGLLDSDGRRTRHLQTYSAEAAVGDDGPSSSFLQLVSHRFGHTVGISPHFSPGSPARTGPVGELSHPPGLPGEVSRQITMLRWLTRSRLLHRPPKPVVPIYDPRLPPGNILITVLQTRAESRIRISRRLSSDRASGRTCLWSSPRTTLRTSSERENPASMRACLRLVAPSPNSHFLLDSSYLTSVDEYRAGAT